MTLTFNTLIYSISCLHLPTFRSQAAIVSEKSTVFTFSHRKAYVTKFDLAIKQVKVTPGSSFEETMMGWCPRCYIPSFVEMGPPIRRRRYLKGFYHMHGGHLGHGTTIMPSDFHFLVPESFHTKFGSDWQSSL